MSVFLSLRVTDEKSRAAAQEFLSWLCEQGEQDYWQWMDARPDEPVLDSFAYDLDKLLMSAQLKKETK